MKLRDPVRIVYKRPQVVIVGSGRSGTSTVARLCHEELGICMGHFLKKPDAMNPKGYYEDLVSHGLVRACVDSYSVEIYLDLMNQFHKDCPAWGVKDPWFLYWPRHKLIELRPKLGIVTIRDINATVESWLKIYKVRNPGQEKPSQEAILHYQNLTATRQEKALKMPEIWTDVLVIDFTVPKTDEEIIKHIRKGLTVANQRG